MKILNTILLFLLALSFQQLLAQQIPLPEHPNPIHQRDQWLNLNGQWDFRFDPNNVGIDENWFSTSKQFDRKITVPFPWGSALSRVDDEADIGWYKRPINIPGEWSGAHTFLIIGAADWKTQAWLDGKMIGSHQGGYVPFEFEITDLITPGSNHTLVIRVDDARRAFTLYGKQGYGNARGIWQTPYLESRGDTYIDQIKFTPNIDASEVEVIVHLNGEAKDTSQAKVNILTQNGKIVADLEIPKGSKKGRKIIPIPDQELWTLDNPYLYNASVVYGEDQVHTYFGMRKISVVNLPGTDIPYIALNNKPIYLQMALDQSYHPEGFYTFPSDQFMQEEIQRSKSIGLNGIRTHIKVEIPRKLYWADKMGLLVMEDLPNSWGEPDEAMQKESIYTLKEMIKRDYNHPSIFSWVLFNETWGLSSTVQGIDGKYGRSYTPSTQQWVASMYYLAKSLDASRLVEDNSICCGRGHTVTDINSWHSYLPGWEWDQYLKELTDSTFVGSGFNYESGWSQRSEPNFNSECGNVWGYQGSTGDVDWSYDYHRMMNSFRMYPKVGGWLYTEHHDVINEWNGYWRFDRTEKFTGFDDIIDGMSLLDLHAPIYLSTGNEITYQVKAGEPVAVPLFLSSMTDHDVGNSLEIHYSLDLIDASLEKHNLQKDVLSVEYKPWMQEKLPDLIINMPDQGGLAKLSLILKQKDGTILHRNFIHFVVSGRLDDRVVVHSSPSKDYASAKWSIKEWNVLDGKKVNGAGKGFFEYEIPISQKIPRSAKEYFFIMEASAKELFVKDQEEYNRNQDFMKGSRVAPSSNPNAYPMTDEVLFSSKVKVTIDGRNMGTFDLPDDPADHRGILSWHAQLKDRKLREAGSYGYLIKVKLTKRQYRKMKKSGKATVRLETIGEGGLAIYGKEFGRYPIDPSIVVR